MNTDNPYSSRNPYGPGQGPIPEDVSSYVNPTAFDPRLRLRKYRPTVGKKVAAWVGVVLGVLLLLGVFSSDGEDLVADLLLSIGFGGMMIIPGAYWLLCNRRDSRTITRWMQDHRAYQANWALLAEDEQAMFAPPEELPVLPLRQWKTIGVCIFCAFVVAMAGSFLLPETASSSTVPT